MKKTLGLLVASALVLGSTLSLAESVAVTKASVSRPAASTKVSKAARLTDAQLDNIVAGSPAIVVTGGGLTIITNSGNASVLNLKSHHGHITCINQC